MKKKKENNNSKIFVSHNNNNSNKLQNMTIQSGGATASTYLVMV